ncbi:PIG-L family deacetylase [Martelella alba]|uniref:PIG-L family deacetylase n=1 Tax=Martelella alba TaxID=2590451 RepID=A0A506UJL0_9HYPH|nr:PIG-L family deacetylase [Martelella alba]TPW33488.1 PIG-L family deacetylase [Martelella alba]
MLSPRERIERQKASPALIRLYRALMRLKSPLTMMNTGAHPDDENSALLAYLSLGLGMRVIVACSTRGEGGQNVLGPERIGALGVLRTREMEEAARELDADIHWLGHGPDDPVHDFGFSKDGDGTFGRWGEERIVERLVRAYRLEKPDIVVPTFLDVPGQHGHHRAMTRAAETAIALAADDKAFPEHFAEGLAPWTVAKYYLPAVSGAGGTYDDDLPPPPETLVVAAPELDAATGAAYTRIGEWSRYYHASQGMGRWPDSAYDIWPLHLKIGPAGPRAEQTITDDLPTSLADLSMGDRDVEQALTAADDAIAGAIAAFPDKTSIIARLGEAAAHIENALALASAPMTEAHGHRLKRKLAEIDAAIFECEALFFKAYMDCETIAPDGVATLSVIVNERDMRDFEITPLLPQGISVTRTEQVGETFEFTLSATQSAPLSRQYAAAWSSMGGNGPVSIRLSGTVSGRVVSAHYDLETPLAVAPANSLTLKPEALLIATENIPGSITFSAELSGPAWNAANLTFDPPPGWMIAGTETGFAISPPKDLAAGLVEISPLVAGSPAANIAPIAYPHIGRTRFIRPEVLKVLSLDLKLPEAARIGYIGGGADRVGLWLKRMGLDVTELDATALGGDLSHYTAIVVGIFAFGTRPDLAAATMRLHRYVEDGGHLVTLYHRPSDGWDPQTVPPRPIKIGTPSLRWRVTDPNAEVRILDPNHPLVTGPNRIGPDDWKGWDKERGLYFASTWDAAYTPLMAMHDPEEQALLGALISGRISKGRHTHTSLVLHHQMDKLVPGAFRLMANLVQPA